MAQQDSSTHSPAEAPRTSIAALGLRIFWMLIGNFGLFFFLLMIARNTDSLVSVLDAIFVVFVPLVIAARYLDVTSYHGTTTYGDPATLEHWRRYAMAYGALAVVGWVAAHGIAYAMR